MTYTSKVFKEPSYNNFNIGRYNFHSLMQRAFAVKYPISDEALNDLLSTLENEGAAKLEEKLLSWSSNIYHSLISYVKEIKNRERLANCPYQKWTENRRYEAYYCWEIEIEDFEPEDEGMDYTYSKWYPKQYAEWLINNPEPTPLPEWTP